MGTRLTDRRAVQAGDSEERDERKVREEGMREREETRDKRQEMRDKRLD